MVQVTGPGVPFVSDIVETPKAPQVLPQGPEIVLGPGLELGPLLECTESNPWPKAGPTPSANHNWNPNKILEEGSADENVFKALYN